MSIGKVTLIVAIAAVAIAAVAGVVMVLVWNSSAAHVTGSGATLATATDQQLEAATKTTVFFGHQSVGGNVISGIDPLYADRGLDAPNVLESREALPGERAVFQHAFIGTNGDPSGKIRDFDSIIRSGVGDRVDVAMMKLCYVDITSATDVEALFAEYRDTIAGLERDYPGVTFVHVTTPITTQRDVVANAKAAVGRPDIYGPDDNATRQRFNELMRQHYAGSPIFDLAAIESTTPEGGRLEGTVDGQIYYALLDQYATDRGHLNAQASTIAAEGLMALLAETKI